jgi:hypothetical protein
MYLVEEVTPIRRHNEEPQGHFTVTWKSKSLTFFCKDMHAAELLREAFAKIHPVWLTERLELQQCRQGIEDNET